MKCPKCGFENPNTVELCQGCRAVKFVKVGAKPAPPRIESPLRHLIARIGASPLELKQGKPFTFGRQHTCSLPIPSHRISRVHAEIRWSGDKPVLHDNNSSNGTFVNGARVKEHALAHGDEIKVGDFLCVYKFADPATLGSSPDQVSDQSRTSANVGDLLTGKIPDAGLAEIVQGLEFNTKTGTLSAHTREGTAWLAVDNGVPLCAEAGEDRDEAAIYQLLDYRDGWFTFSPDVRCSEKRVKLNFTSLLLEWGRRADERSANLGETRDS